MDAYTFWEHVISVFIWAVVVVVVVFILRVPIGDVMRRLTNFKFKHGDTELSFEQAVRRNRPKVKAVEELKVVDPKDFQKPERQTPNALPAPDDSIPLLSQETEPSHERLDEFVGTPQDSVRPSLVVEIAWRGVMDELRNLLVAKGKLGELERPSLETMLASILGDHLLPTLIIDSISGLYGTKLQVSSNLYFEPEWESTKEYEAQAQKVVRAIRRYV